MNSRLGLFDSGVGGLTVLQRVVQRHGDFPCLYLGDTARVPYGSRSESEIRFIAREISEWLLDQSISAILIACNTTNSLALDIIQTSIELPVYDLISGAAEMIEGTRIGVLATEATVNSHSYKKRIETAKPGTFVLEQSCPAFVPMIETGQLTYSVLNQIASKYLAPLIDAGVDEIVLGCSHYPLIQDLLIELLPENVRLVDPSVGLAMNLDDFLGEPSSQKSLTQISNTRFCVTSDPIGFSAQLSNWLGINPEVELISLPSKACVF